MIEQVERSIPSSPAPDLTFVSRLFHVYHSITAKVWFYNLASSYGIGILSVVFFLFDMAMLVVVNCTSTKACLAVEFPFFQIARSRPSWVPNEDNHFVSRP